MEPVRTSRSNTFLYLLANFLLWCIGWRAQGPVPKIKKFVLIGAPHTSFWDAPVGLIIAFSLRLRTTAFIKHTAFFWPFGLFLRYLGAVPVDRRLHQNMVDHAVDIIEKSDEIVPGMAPEGTRSNAGYWKSGFYYMALKAKVPILLVFFDYRRKVVGRGPILYPTGNVEADLEVIRRFYDTVTPRHPENRCPVRFRNMAPRAARDKRHQGQPAQHAGA